MKFFIRQVLGILLFGLMAFVMVSIGITVFTVMLVIGLMIALFSAWKFRYVTKSIDEVLERQRQEMQEMQDAETHIQHRRDLHTIEGEYEDVSDKR